MVGHCFSTLGEISRYWCRKRISMPALFISTNSHDANFEKNMLCMLDTWWKHVYLVAPACTHFHLQGVWQVQEVWQSQVNPCNVHVCTVYLVHSLLHGFKEVWQAGVSWQDLVVSFQYFLKPFQHNLCQNKLALSFSKSLSRALRKLSNVDLLHWLKNGSGDGRGGSKDIRSSSGPRSALAGGAKLHPPSLTLLPLQMQTA